ncbi:MAG: NTP transferase domain-containing protein [Gemmatimonadaceae bacterium]|nr:NTP transferase domain-containing protein [Gemmatimonadaceae bacterium]
MPPHPGPDSRVGVVLLAAGSGRRLAPLTARRPKALLDVHGRPVIVRQLDQLRAAGFDDITVVTGYREEQVRRAVERAGHRDVRFVHNRGYATDTNLRSALMGTAHAHAVLLVEADMIVPDAAWPIVARGAADPDATLWYTNGAVQPDQMGGMLTQDRARKITGLTIERTYRPGMRRRRKLAGIVQIGSEALSIARRHWLDLSDAGRDAYFHAPWLDGLAPLGGARDLGAAATLCFNTPAEYYRALLRAGPTMAPLGPWRDVRMSDGLSLVPVRELRHIENYSRRRAQWLRGKIEREGVWRVALAVDPAGLVMDGQHRFEVARALGLAFVPAAVIDYRDVTVWSLRDNYTVTRDEIVRRAMSGEIYPYKTAKHGFHTPMPEVHIPLELLRSFRVA